MKEEMLSVTAEQVTKFGRFALARESRVLYAEGRRVPLNERALDALIALLDARGKIVSVEQLQQGFWPASSIVANSVQALMSQLRRALGDDRDLIETVPRRGYRLAAESYEFRDEFAEPRTGAATFALPEGPSPPADGAPPHQSLSESTSASEAAAPNAAPYSPLLGRDAELSELLMRVPQHRLVTLMGSRGIGKSRLAREAALRIAALYQESAVFIDMNDLTAPGGVADTIAARMPPLSSAARPATCALDDLIARLANRQALLVIENGDHLAQEVASVIDALIAATRVCVIVCAEAPLFSAAEYLLPLAPLRCAPKDATGAASDACRLFSAQLQTLGALPDETKSAARDAMESVCRVLAGNALALELVAHQIAAATRRGTTLEQALAGWEKLWRHTMLQRAGSAEIALRPADLVPSVIALAYHALHPHAQHVLCCTSLFAGRFNSADADIVSKLNDDATVRTHLSALINAGLLTSAPQAFAVRMPPPVRQFGLAVLAHRPDHTSITARHAHHVAKLASESSDSPSARALPIADVRRALHWSMESGHLEVAARLLQHSSQLWTDARLSGERLLWVRRTLERDRLFTLKVRDHMLLHMALAQALQPGVTAHSTADSVEAWWRVYELATACADDDNRLHALTVLLIRTLESGFDDDQPDLLASVRTRIAQECVDSSTHRGFALLRGVLLTMNGRHHEAIALLAQPEEKTAAAADSEAALPSARQPDYVAAISHNALAISLWLTGARANSHPALVRALNAARRQPEPVSRCASSAMACLLFLLEDNGPRIAQQARLLCAIAQRAGLQGWLNVGRGFLLWIDAVDDTADAAHILTKQALRNLTRSHATILDLLALEKFAHLALASIGGPVLLSLFEEMIGGLKDGGRRWLLPEALRVNAVLSRHAGAPAADVRAILERAAHEARDQHATTLAQRISALQEQMS
ncbi:ATP-binding protein [Caballeronia mineralivorans]|jgi:DNA-binding winged helix-turn-helix (wHTH) protein/predicted ATPase|uniref:ATP-binding protein n=1 Tax=Caballeronia mineralivorans TaxID=2010198 RepID=UPI0023F342CE|nr:winged helix-turn-helix domain-containing protein [Caballeronia mineralivorans]MDB5787019.1 hypothetical protein [Caballeronia mineralivorans]MEA3098914.1 hypothetical protein [Caballeronia mineralivorans]